MDIAELGIKVDSNGVVSADKALDDFAKAAKGAEEATDKLNDEQQRGTATAKKFGDQMENSGKSLSFVKGAILGVVGAIGAFVGTAVSIKAFVDATSEAEGVQAQLAAALTSTKGASGQAINSLNETATALMGMSTFGDEAIGTAQSLLLTFTRIGGETFPRATQAVLDLAARMGGDLNGAAMKLGKALNDPTVGLTMLSRSGVQFTEAQQEMIKKLQESGRLIEAQNIILDEFEKKLGGSALAARETLGGAITALNEAFGNLFELSGPASEQLRVAIEGLVTAISDPAFLMFVQTIGVAFFTAMRGAIELINVLIGILPILADNLIVLAPAMIAVFGPTVLAGIEAVGVTIMGTVVKAILALNAAILANPIAAFVVVLATVVAYMVDWEKVIRTLIQAWSLFMYEWNTFWGNEAGAKRSIEIGINATEAVAELKQSAVDMSNTVTQGFSIGGSDAGQKVQNAMVNGGSQAAAKISQSFQMTGERANAIWEGLNGKVIKPLGNVLVDGGKFIYNQVTGAIEKAAPQAGNEMFGGVKDGGKEAGNTIRSSMMNAGQQVGGNLFSQLVSIGDVWSNSLQKTMGDILGSFIRSQQALIDAQAAQAQSVANLNNTTARLMAEDRGRSSGNRDSGGRRSSSSGGGGGGMSFGGSWGSNNLGLQDFMNGPRTIESTAPDWVGPTGSFSKFGYGNQITDGSEFLPGARPDLTAAGVSFRTGNGERAPSQMGSPAPQGGRESLVIQNFFDPKDMLNALQTAEGREVLTNYIVANRDELQSLLGV